MAAFRLILCAIVATIMFCSLIDAAAFHNLVYADDRAESGDITFPESIRDRRSIRTVNDDQSRVCQGSTPCGWAVYEAFTRRLEYFMRNVCNCPASYKCIRTEDDLSVSAYVYRCRSNSNATDIEAPNTN